MADEHLDPLDDEDRALSDAFDVAADLAKRCRRLDDAVKDRNIWTNQDILGRVVNFLMTEFWDQGFSQTQIREAFLDAVADMNRYAAGEERRS